jgi:hypothetical protein
MKDELNMIPMVIKLIGKIQKVMKNGRNTIPMEIKFMIKVQMVKKCGTILEGI